MLYHIILHPEATVLIHNIGPTAFENTFKIISAITNFILIIFRNFVPLFILFVFAYYILIKLLNIREDER